MGLVVFRVLTAHLFLIVRVVALCFFAKSRELQSARGFLFCLSKI